MDVLLSSSPNGFWYPKYKKHPSLSHIIIFARAREQRGLRETWIGGQNLKLGRRCSFLGEERTHSHTGMLQTTMRILPSLISKISIVLVVSIRHIQL